MQCVLTIKQVLVSMSFFVSFFLSLFFCRATMCVCVFAHECDANKFDLVHLHILLNKQGDHQISVRRYSGSSNNIVFFLFFTLFSILIDFFFLFRSLQCTTYKIEHLLKKMKKKAHTGRLRERESKKMDRIE